MSHFAALSSQLGKTLDPGVTAALNCNKPINLCQVNNLGVKSRENKKDGHLRVRTNCSETNRETQLIHRRWLK